jgi:hypothetical protein
MRWGLAFALLVYAVGLSAGPSAVRAEEAESQRSLTDILKDKGIISAEEAEEAGVLEDPKAVSDVRAGYRVGKGLYFEAPNDLFAAYLGTRTQLRFTYGHREDRSDDIDFRIRRLKVYIEGYALLPELEYKLQVDLGDGDAQLEDVFLRYVPFSFLSGRFGQFKPPQGKQELTSSGKLQLVERSDANDFFNLNRDRGIELGGLLSGDLVQYSIGVFDGNGPNERNINMDLLYGARINVTPLGPYPEDECDIDSVPDPRLTFGASASFNTVSKGDVTVDTITDSTGAVIDEDVSFNLNSKNDILNNFIIRGIGQNGLAHDVDLFLWTINAGFKYRGFSFSSEGYIAGSNVHGGGPEPWASGFYFQSGYFILPQRLEGAVQYSWIDPDHDLAQARGIRRIQALRGGVSYYIFKQALKIQADLGPIQTERFGASTRNDLEFRTQVQFIL